MDASHQPLAAVPEGLRNPLISSYNEIVNNYKTRKWGPSELHGGKLCEVAYTVVRGILEGTFEPKPSKPQNFAEACRNLERFPATPARSGDHSLRVLIPRALLALYDIRNNRGVGHVGGDVDPNFMDASLVLSISSWIMAELVRILHRLSVAEAQAIVDALVERRHPLVWEVSGSKHVLDASMSKSNQVLLLLHNEAGPVTEADLHAWVEYSSLAAFRRDVLKRLHSRRLVKYDQAAGQVWISPLGVKLAEEAASAQEEVTAAKQGRPSRTTPSRPRSKTFRRRQTH